jgi:hypothetical protein
MKARKIFGRKVLLTIDKLQKGSVYRIISQDDTILASADFWYNTFVWIAEEDIYSDNFAAIRNGSLLVVNKHTLYTNTKFSFDFKFREIEKGKKIIANFFFGKGIDEFIKIS